MSLNSKSDQSMPLFSLREVAFSSQVALTLNPKEHSFYVSSSSFYYFMCFQYTS